MAFVAGKDTKILVGEENLSGFFRSFDLGAEAAVLETTVFGNADRAFIVGLRNGTLSAEGYFDAAADAIDIELQALLGQVAGEPLTLGPEGLVVPNRAYMISGKETRYSVTAPVDGVVAASADFQADGGIGFGVSLHDLVAETATGTGTIVANGASTANGGSAHIHLTAVTAVGGDTFDVTIHHSTDNFAANDVLLATFAQFTTTKTSQRIIIAAGTTIEKDVRVDFTKGGAGSPSYTFAVALTRAL